MSRSQNSLRISPLPIVVALVAVSSWVSGCGDDDKASGGKGGSGATSGSAGSANGGAAGTPTGGSAGTPTGGSAGTPTGGSAGAMAGNAGSAGTAGMGGEGGDPGMGGEGGQGVGGVGEGGMGVGGEGGATGSVCISNNLSFTLVSSAPMQAHDHLPVAGMSRMTLIDMINTGMPLIFTLPEDGSNPHQHTLTFTAQQLTVLRNGGELAMNVTTSMGGPMGNMHTHTYSIECEP
jgi:hypothetical protein